MGMHDSVRLYAWLTSLNHTSTDTCIVTVRYHLEACQASNGMLLHGA